MSTKQGQTASLVTMEWLVRLRWTAVVGQSLTVLIAHYVLPRSIPVAALFACISVTALSNLAARFQSRFHGTSPDWLAGALMATDVVVLTALLALSGGSANPFATFYLVHATMAALVLPGRGAWMIWGLCSAGYASLFLQRSRLSAGSETWCGPGANPDLHLFGMLVSLTLTGAAIAYFVGRIVAALQDRDQELAQTREREAQHLRFAAVATLAAGAAHELASPLGTIAVAAGELVHRARTVPDFPELAGDAELIKSEVTRCRTILDRLQQTADDAPRLIGVEDLLSALRGKVSADATRIQVRIDSKVTHVVAPVEGLIQSLAALVKNAFDASPGQEAVALNIRRTADAVVFDVCDQGPGLEPEARRHAGEPFFTTKSAGQGMGLGLFLVRLYARRLGGSFILVPAGDRGTIASLSLPQSA